MAEAKPEIKGSINLILDYKKGTRPLKETVERLGAITGLSPSVAESFLRNMARENVYQFPDKFKKTGTA